MCLSAPRNVRSNFGGAMTVPRRAFSCIMRIHATDLYVNICFIKGGFMPRRPIESLGALVRKKRGTKKLRETAREIEIGPATLMRVESGRIPDLDTFGKLCK